MNEKETKVYEITDKVAVRLIKESADQLQKESDFLRQRALKLKIDALLDLRMANLLLKTEELPPVKLCACADKKECGDSHKD